MYRVGSLVTGEDAAVLRDVSGVSLAYPRPVMRDKDACIIGYISECAGPVTIGLLSHSEAMGRLNRGIIVTGGGDLIPGRAREGRREAMRELRPDEIED